MNKLMVLVLLAGCTKTESDDVLTSGVYASITAEASGNGKTLVEASLFVGNPIGLNFLELAGDDALIAKSSGMAKAMVEVEILNSVAHRAEFPGDADGAQFEVAFERTIDAGAPSSTATLPAKFEITTSPTTASRAQSMMLGWAPAGGADMMSWSAHGDCIQDESGTSNLDEGAFVIPAGTFEKRMGDNIADQCAVTFTVRRSRAGMLDAHYGKGGQIFGRQARTVTVTSTP